MTFKDRFRRADINRTICDSYYESILHIPSTSLSLVNQFDIPSDKFYQKEHELFCVKQLQPPISSFSCQITITYSSPQGRSNQYWSHIYQFDEIKKHFLSVEANRQKKAQYQQSREYERSKMTNSLRYDVMKRDGFRCVLCGASPKDGVKLHVDHIRPVAKGGKTEIANLRTLCDRCNSGKRDKYDPSGDN